MNLEKWANIPDNERRDKIVRLFKQNCWDVYENLAMVASVALREALISNPEITGVQIGAGRAIGEGDLSRVREFTLLPCTLLHEGTSLKFIPPSFMGFQVELLNLGDKKSAYLNTWKRLFSELKGWDEQQTLRWAEKWDDALSGRMPSTLYHYGPIKTTLSALLDPKTRQLAGNNLRFLESAVLMLLMHPKGTEFPTIHHPDMEYNYDWDSVRQRFKELVKRYTTK